MTIYFDFINETFYSSDIHSRIPKDAVEISSEKHQELLNALNSGCVIFADLTYSEPKPSQFHEWNGSAWVDSRTEEDRKEHERSLMPNLSRIEFKYKLHKAGRLKEVENFIATTDNFLLRLAYNEAQFFSRTDPLLSQALEDLDWTDEQVDEIWTS